MAMLIEIGLAGALFVAEIIAIGYLLEEVRKAWQPVQDNGESVRNAIGMGTALLIAIGTACALLGVAAVGSVGLLPAAIALGTAMLVEVAIAAVALVESLMKVADTLGNKLAPALEDLNSKLPELTTNMDNYVKFMKEFAESAGSITTSMGKMTWDSIVQGVQNLFAGNPIDKLARNVETIRNDTATLNAKLVPANTELEAAITLLGTYNTLMGQLKALCQENGSTTLKSGMFTNLKAVGQQLVLGFNDGVKSKTPEAQACVRTLGASMESTSRSTFAAGTFSPYGGNIVQGLIQGINNNIPRINNILQNLCMQIRNIIQNQLRIHSPSKFTDWCGEMLMLGLTNGVVDNTQKVVMSAQDAASQLTDAIQPDVADTNLLAGMTASADGALNALTSWSTNFVNTLAVTFDVVSAMFDAMTNKLNTATANMSAVPTAINAKMGSLSAVDNIKSSDHQNTPGTPTVAQVIATLSEETINKLSGNIADRLYEYLAPLFAIMSNEDQQRAIAYVGTLIADDAGLKELERKLKVIRISEGRRG